MIWGYRYPHSRSLGNLQMGLSGSKVSQNLHPVVCQYLPYITLLNLLGAHAIFRHPQIAKVKVLNVMLLLMNTSSGDVLILEWS